MNRIRNALDIVNDLDFKANTAQEAIGKIERLSKLVQGGQVNICDVLMAGAIRDNISDGSKIALANTMALLDREREQVRFNEFKSAFKQTFTTTPPSDTFYGQNPSGNYDYHNKERRGRTRSKDRATGRHKDYRPRNKSPHRPRRDSTHSPGIRDNNNWSCFTFTSFHTNGPSKTNFLLDTGAQRSCMGEDTFTKMGGDLKSLKKSKNRFA